MTKKTLFLALLVGAVAAVGVPWAPGPESGPSDPDLVTSPADPLRSLLSTQSGLEKVYDDWAVSHAKAGGDRSVEVRLVHAEGLSTRPMRARGQAFLDLVEGTVRVEVQGLDGPADAWLIDDQEGPGRSMLPEPGDRAVRVGRLAGGARSVARANLGPEFFPSFELDLVVVTPAGVRPGRDILLLGGRPAFERIFTRTRLAAERREAERARLLGFGPASLAALLAPAPAEADSTQVLIAHGLISQMVGDGGDLFFRETFDGNGRTCGTCHPVDNNQTIEPAFIATLPPDDPLFVAEFPKSQGGVPGLERPALMRQFGLILENADGFEDPTVKFVMRGVPHSLSLATSITAVSGFPLPEATGWSGDGSPDGTLNMFPTGAVIQHFTKDLKRREGRDFRLPTTTELEAMEVFMLSVGRLNDLDLIETSLADASADRGRRIFLNTGSDGTIPAGKCNNCHLNAGAERAFLGGGNANFDTGVEDVPHPAREVEDFPFDGGLGTELNEEGTFGDMTFNTAGLVEAADTAPFFHNNVVETLKGAVEFYSTGFFNESAAGQAVGGIDLNGDATANDDVTAFLRVINAAFNLAISIQRNEAAFTLENSSGFGGCSEGGFGEIGEECTGGRDTGKRATVDALLSLSNAEALDAVEVLEASSLHPDAVTLIRDAIAHNEQAIAESASQVRKDLIGQALQELQDAEALFGSGAGFSFDMGEGNLMF